MKLFLKTLTPIHVGTGNKLSRQDFFKNHRINFNKFINYLGDKHFNELENFLNENENIQTGIDNYIKKFQLNEKFIIEKFSLYNFDNYFGNEVNEGIKDNANKLYIPGSSIKGMLRTALMYNAMKSSISLGEITSKIQSNLKDKVSDKDKKESDKLIEQEVFMCGVQKKDRIDYSDQKYDLLKLVKISDSTSVDVNENGEISKISLYALNNQSKHKVRGKELKIFTESITEGQILEFELSIDIYFLKRARELIKSNDEHFGKKYWIGIENKLKSLFGIDINSDEELSEGKIIDHIIRCIVKFGKAVSDLEKKWFDSVNSKNSQFKNVYESENKFKLGFATGFSGMTILSLLLDAKNLKSITEDIYKKFGIGKHSNGSDLKIDKFPFTRRYSDQNGQLSCFGWCSISKDNFVESNKETFITESKIIPDPNWIIAEIIDDKSNPPKVKIIAGDFKDSETDMPKVRITTFGIKKGDKVYVELSFDKKKKIEKANYKGKVNE